MNCTSFVLPLTFSFYFYNVYLFLWLYHVLVVACGIFSCGKQTLSCSLWDLVPIPGPCFRSGPQGSPSSYLF